MLERWRDGAYRVTDLSRSRGMRARGALALPLILSALGAYPATAADVAAPAPAAGRDPFEGFYAGAHVGDVFDAKSSYGTDPMGVPGAGATTLVGEDGEYGPVFSGFEAGYNHVLRPGVLLGIEGDFSFPDALFTNLGVTFPTSGSSIVNDNVEIFGSLRGRVGYVRGKWLVYATGGIAYDRDRIIGTENAGDEVYVSRPGFVVGAGIETFLSAKLSAKFEYQFFDFAHESTYLPAADGHYTSNLSFQTLRFGLNYHFDADPAAPGDTGGILSGRTLENLSIHAQSTIIGQANAPFPAAYTGTNSLFPGFQARETFSVTGFFGYKAAEGTEFYYNPEPFQGFGLSQTKGLAGFSNLEAQKAGFDFPHYNTSRLFLRQVIGLGGEREDLPDGPNQVAETVDVSRLTTTFGKLSVPDIFDNNTYAHDGRVGFLNWSINDGGAFDYAADQKGYTYGAALELNKKDWAARVGYFLLPDDPNTNNFDTRVFRRGQYLAEVQHGYTFLGSPGIFRLTGWESQCFCGSFAATLTNPGLIDPLTDGGTPDIAATRKTRSEFGFIGNFEQAVTTDLGLFARLSYQSGQTEIEAWTDIDESLSFGGVLKGTAWGRPKDTVGLAGVVNGLSGNYQRFLGIGGLGINIGDGQLSYRPEQIIESYYSIGLGEAAALTFDYQFIANPADNDVRGPVSIGSVRLHFAL